MVMVGLFDTRVSDASRIHFVEMANAYAALGHRVTVVCPRRPAGEKLFAANVRVRATGWYHTEGLLRAAWNNLRLLGRYGRVARHGCDVVHVRWRLLPAWTLRLVNRLCGVRPLVLSEHNGWVELEMRLQHGSRLLAWLARQLQLTDARSTDAVLAVTDGIRELLMKHGVPGEKIFVVGNGTNTRQFFPLPQRAALRRELPGVEDNDVVLGFIGNISRWQGLDELLEAFAAIGAAHSNVHLLVAGDGYYKAELERRWSGLPRLHLRGNIPYDEVNGWMNRIDIALAPKARELEAVGYSPLKIRDYAAAGCAVVTTRVRGLRELEPHGWLRTYDTPAELRALLLELISQPEQREGMRVLARDYAVKHFAWERIAAQVITEVEARR